MVSVASINTNTSLYSTCTSMLVLDNNRGIPDTRAWLQMGCRPCDTVFRFGWSGPNAASRSSSWSLSPPEQTHYIVSLMLSAMQTQPVREAEVRPIGASVLLRVCSLFGTDMHMPSLCTSTMHQACHTCTTSYNNVLSPSARHVSFAQVQCVRDAIYHVSGCSCSALANFTKHRR